MARPSVVWAEAVVSGAPGIGRCASMPPVRVIEPSLAIWRIAYLAARAAPQKRTSIRALLASMSRSWVGPNMWPQSPAVKTRWSKGPAASKKVATEASSFTSTVWPLAPRPSFSAAASMRGAWLEPTTTSAPASSAAAATAKPTPDAPPITTTFAPSSFAMMWSPMRLG